MSRLFTALVALILLASCENNGYTIKGSFPSAPDGAVVYMTAADDYFTTIDSAKVDNGYFEFTGGYHDRIVRMLLVPSKAIGGPVVVENGVINVNFGNTMERSGTEGNAILQRFMDAKEHLEGLEGVTSSAYLKSMPMDKSVCDSLVAEREKARAKLAAYAYFAIENNIDNNLGLFLMTKSYKMIDAERLFPLLERVPSYLRDTRFDFVNDYVSTLVNNNRNKAGTAVGRTYLNFELPDINDEKVIFSSFVNKNRYTLLQFWASWCAPCRMELPKITKLCGKYGKQGFAAVGVSLDADAGEWRNAVSSLGLSWRQLCSPSGGSNEVAAAYGVDALPSNILINSKGTIIARDLTASELDSILASSVR